MGFNVHTSITSSGLRLDFDCEGVCSTQDVVFPLDIWKVFPDYLKKQLRDNLAYLSTVELALMFNAKEIHYDTAVPLFKAYFNELFWKYFLYSGDSDCGDALKHYPDFARMTVSFEGDFVLFSPDLFPVSERSVNTLTFGKESLLSFGLARELGLDPVLFTVLDPDLDVDYRGERVQSFTNKHLRKLACEFEKEFDVQVHFIENGLGNLRCNVNWDLDDTDLGSANVITEFLFLGLPLVYHYGCKYILFGNEYSCDSSYVNEQGYTCFPVYDQSTYWMREMNQMLSILTSGLVGAFSLVQPLQELAVAKVLYQRYPNLARYQMSCHADNLYAAENRWCGHCSKCARCYVFMKGLGFDPVLVGLSDMSGLDKKEYFSLFSSSKEMCAYDLAGVGREEQLFAFFLAIERGASGGLFDLFRSLFYEESVLREKEFRAKFFTVYRPVTIPEHLWPSLKVIFEEEMRK